jgi:tetratricopeptide (TPR) repeat protein
VSSKKQRNAARRQPDRIAAAPPPVKHSPRRPLWSRATLSDTPLAALAITLLVYLRCIGNAFVFDDNEMIVINRSIGDWAMIWRSFVNDSWWFRNPNKLPQSAYYRPLQDVWLSVNYHLFGFNPAGWHILIIAMHLVAVWLVFRIARELTDSRQSRWTPIIAATLFGVLPVHAQAVVWPTAIPLPMAAVFMLGALLGFIRSERDRNASKLLAPTLYALALLSHESAVGFPFIALAYVVLLCPESASGSRVRRAAIASAPFFIELAIYLAIRFLVLGFLSRLNLTSTMTRAQEILTIPSVLGTYLLMLIEPWRASPVHPVGIVSSMTSGAFYLPILALVGIFGAAVFALWSDRYRSFYLFCALWMAVSIAPVLNLRAFTPIALVEDRYLYMASAAWCLAIAQLAVTYLPKVEPSGRLLAAATAIATLACVIILFHVESFWHDEYALFSTCVERSPGSSLCHDRLGVALIDRGDISGAEQQFQLAYAIAPDAGVNLYHLGSVHVRMGRTEEALGELKRALAILNDAPAGAYIEYAKLADSIGKTAERDDALQKAARRPGGAKAVELARAELMINHGDLAGAEGLMRAAIARDPGGADYWTMLGVTLSRQGRNEEALEAYQHSLSLKPDRALQRIVSQMERNAPAHSGMP